jgi:hypothetical protein
MSGMTRAGTMVNTFYGHCEDCDEPVEYSLPAAQVGETTNIRVRCPSCSDPVICHVGSMPSRQGRRAVVFTDTGCYRIRTEGSA